MNQKIKLKKDGTISHQGEGGGCPLKFNDIDELENCIKQYFESTHKDEWTITGLAIALDTVRSVLVDYGKGKYDDKDRKFSNTIKKAKHMVEHSYEIDLKKHGRPGTIFALKNFDWVDKTEVEQKIEADIKDLREEIENMTPDEKAKELSQRLKND